MIAITEESIGLSAPNPAAIANAKKISKNGDFTTLNKSKDESLIFGDCKGSGKTPYSASADFINSENPVFRCTCPSRQFPCKHVLGLMYDYLANKTFTVAEIPESIADKRKKQDAKQEKAKTQQDAPVKKQNKAALAKKMQRQLEGLNILQQFVHDVLQSGLAALGSNSIKTYQDLAKQLGDYYLPGPQGILNRILIEMDQIQKDSVNESIYYGTIITQLIQLQNIVKKGRSFLSDKVSGDSLSMEDSTLYNHIGYIWQLSQLKELGLIKEKAQLVQLSFQIVYDSATKQYTDIGYWIDLQSGEISKKENYRPVKALKHIKQDDTFFDVLQTPCLYYYPGERNKRIRWEEFSTRSLTEADYSAIRGFARTDLSAVVKETKNQIKNALSEQTILFLIAFHEIGMIGNRFVLETQPGDRIELRNPAGESVLNRLHYITDTQLLKQQVMAGELFYDSSNQQIGMIPHSIITSQQMIRLLY